MEDTQALVPMERIEAMILVLRGEKVILDAEIAGLYGVATKVLVQAMKRNVERFPEDFMFQLTQEEVRILTSQSVISSWGGRRHLPYAFTEQGVAMLSSVLRSERAVQVNVEVMRTFVRLRRMTGVQAELARKLESLEQRYDDQFKVVFDALRELMMPAETGGASIGFD
ncbi:MAG TPA: ORF6N domain-containing protein [Thermoanaerobaculia bacterium]